MLPGQRTACPPASSTRGWRWRQAGSSSRCGSRTIGPVWLTRRFWSLIDGAYFYRSYPEELAPDRGNSAAATVEALVLWHTAWLHGALDGLFFWIGDARRESALPTNWSSDVITRYERLSAAFPVVNGGETAAPPVEPLTACGQEAFALAAALTTDAPIILTASQQHGQPPLICTEAAAIAHIDVHGPTEWTPMPAGPTASCP